MFLGYLIVFVLQVFIHFFTPPSVFIIRLFSLVVEAIFALFIVFLASNLSTSFFHE